MCDTLVRVSADRVLFAKNSDREANEPQIIEWHGAADHAERDVRCTHVSIPQVPHTHAIVISRPIWMWGAEIGTNEHGVTIGNEAVFTKEPVPKEGALTGMDLVRLALERSSNAEKAVQTIVDLHERHGQGGRCGYRDTSFRYFSSFLVADPNEAWVVETAGRSSAVEKVSGARTISNVLTIAGFAETHSDRIRTGVARGRTRRSCTAAAIGKAETLGDLARALRDHGGHAWPRYSPISGAMDSVCMHAGGLVASSQTTASWIAELSPGGMRHFATGTSAPCLSLFKPIALDRLDTGGEELWWSHEHLHRAVMKDPETLAPLFVAERDALERRFLQGIPPEVAWQEARAATEEWIRRVDARTSRDVRPWWARRHWIRNERDARRSAAR